MDATTAQTLIDKYLAAYQAWVAARGDTVDTYKDWGALFSDPSTAGFFAEYNAALVAGCVARYQAYDPTQLAADLAEFKAIAAAQGITGTLT